MQAVHDHHGDHRRTVFIAGASKNSSALVCDALNYDGRYRLMYEPFSDTTEPFGGVQHRLMWRTYLSPDDESSEFRTFAKRIVTGRIHSAQVDRWTAPGSYDRRLISEARLNLWLKWLRLNFEGMPMILVMRHPCAAVSARVLLERSTRLKFVLEDDEFVSRYLAPFSSTIKSAKSPLERHALMWAIEHYVPLHELPNDLHVVSYEDFIAQPEAEVRRMLAYVGEVERVPTPLPDGLVQRHARTMNTWRNHLSVSDTSRIMDIVAAFGLDGNYSIPAQAASDTSQSLLPDTDSPASPKIFNLGPARNLDGNDGSRRSSTAQQMAQVVRELGGNLVRFEQYIAALQRMLYKLLDNDEWQMHDWDWLWPRHDGFTAIETDWIRHRANPAAAAEDLWVSIDSAYDWFRNVPPDLDRCAAQWDGEANTFLRYMVVNLGHCMDTARFQVQEVTERLTMFRVS